MEQTGVSLYRWRRGQPGVISYLPLARLGFACCRLDS